MRICVNISTVYNDMLIAKGLTKELNPYYNLPYNPSAPFVRSVSILSHSFGDEIFTKRTSLYMTYIQGICNPYKVSFEILPTYSELNG